MFRNVESTSNSRFVKARPGGTRGETAKSPASPCSATLPAPQIMGFGTVLRASGFLRVSELIFCSSKCLAVGLSSSRNIANLWSSSNRPMRRGQRKAEARLTSAAPKKSGLGGTPDSASNLMVELKSIGALGLQLVPLLAPNPLGHPPPVDERLALMFATSLPHVSSQELPQSVRWLPELCSGRSDK